jgi:protoporphyrinogen oxidase
MKVAIIGAGFSGLAAGWELVKNGAEVEIFESQDKVGGLAVGFKEKNWGWTAEKFYHHIFTNDSEVIRLSKEVGIEPLWRRPVTAVYFSPKSSRDTAKRGRGDLFPGLDCHVVSTPRNDKINNNSNSLYQFDSAIDLLKFPGLNLIDKLRMGLVLAVFKLLPDGKFLEKWTAEKGLKFLMGETGYRVIWEPLLTGKFSEFSSKVNLAWFWARIKKRTPSLGTFPGGFQALADKIAERISKLGGKIYLNSRVDIDSLENKFDSVLSTSAAINHHPSSIIHYLDAHVLFLELNKPFLPSGIYWLNILDRDFPFLVVCEHTNFVGIENFGGKHLLYVGNYLPKNHRLFSLTPEKILQEFLPWLLKINPNFSRKNIDKYYVSHGFNAQPVMTINYSRQIPPVKVNDKLYAINQAMIYPWDRGINYAVKLGHDAAREIIASQLSFPRKRESI